MQIETHSEDVTMKKLIYRYTFGASIPLEEVEATLRLAVLAAEGLHSEAEVRLEGFQAFDSERRRCVIDAATVVGRDINRLFLNFIRHEFGADAFQVERVEASTHKQAQEAHS
jgi:hypothetical protein